MCCDKLATTQYFFSKNNVLWQKIRWQIHATMEPFRRGFKRKRSSQIYNDFRPVEGYISETVQDMR